MSARTPDELSKSIRQDLAWRRKEIQTWRSLVTTSADQKQQAILRGAIASLYAHWEGFIKRSCREYLEYVQTRKLNHQDLALPLLSIIFRRHLQVASESTKLDNYCDFFELLLAEWGRRSHFANRDALFSTSNLTSVIFKSYIRALALPYRDDYATAEKPIIDSLVESRNQLAHGEWKVVEAQSFTDYCSWIEKLINHVATDIESAASGSKYRRQRSEFS